MSTTRSSDGLVLGETVQVCVDGVMAVFRSRMREMLDEQGIEEPDPTAGEWYPMEKFLQVLEAVEADAGENALRKVGESTPQFMEWPATVDEPSAALESLSGVYEDAHRDVSGEITVELTGDETAEIVSTTPYPHQWEVGFIKGTAEEFGSPFTRVDVSDSGGGPKRYEVRW